MAHKAVKPFAESDFRAHRWLELGSARQSDQRGAGIERVWEGIARGLQAGAETSLCTATPRKV